MKYIALRLVFFVCLLIKTSTIELSIKSFNTLKRMKEKVISNPFFSRTISHTSISNNLRISTSSNLPYQNNGASIIALMFARFLGSLIDSTRDKGDSDKCIIHILYSHSIFDIIFSKKVNIHNTHVLGVYLFFILQFIYLIFKLIMKYLASFILFFIFVVTTQNTVTAQNYNSTFGQVAYGSGNYDSQFGNNTENGNMWLFTLDHVSEWSYGGNYAFVNFMYSDLMTPDLQFDKNGNPLFNDDGTPVQGSEGPFRVYTEWSPWLSLNKITGKDLGFWIFKDFSIEGQLNVSYSSFYALLGGVGMTFNTKNYDTFLKLMVYYKAATFAGNTDNLAQITGVYDIPLSRKLGIRLQGFFDFIPNSNYYWGTDFLAEPRILYNLGQHFMPDEFTKLEVGLDLFMHYNDQISVTAPQAAVRLTW